MIVLFAMGESLLDISFCSDFSFCMSEPDDQPQSINIDLSNGSPLGNDILVVAHWNINSILAEGRLGELTENVNALKAKVVVLSETKLDETIPNSLISIPGFHEPIRSDRNRPGEYSQLFLIVQSYMIGLDGLDLSQTDHYYS